VKLLQKFAEDVAEYGTVEHTPTIDGRNMVMVIGPHKTKAAAKAEAQAKRKQSSEPKDSAAAPKPEEVETKEEQDA
ncbi:MAG TPA: translation initiation factor IF-3, partial [Terrimesophilobacter sp.]|nr:translation initiation factor IF-3 [Terrimesophilobacter sp.]